GEGHGDDGRGGDDAFADADEDVDGHDRGGDLAERLRGPFTAERELEHEPGRGGEDAHHRGGEDGEGEGGAGAREELERQDDDAVGGEGGDDGHVDHVQAQGGDAAVGEQQRL